MANGLDMLMKSFGLDPAEIKKTVEGMGQGVVQVNDRLTRIEATNNEILEILKNGQPKTGTEPRPLPGSNDDKPDGKPN